MVLLGFGAVFGLFWRCVCLGHFLACRSDGHVGDSGGSFAEGRVVFFWLVEAVAMLDFCCLRKSECDFWSCLWG